MKQHPELNVTDSPWNEVEADWLIIGVPEGDPPPEMDVQLGGLLGRLRDGGDFTGKANEKIPVYSQAGVKASRVLLIGLGKPDTLNFGTLLDRAATATRHLTGKERQRIAMLLPTVNGIDAESATVAAAVGLMCGCYGPGIRKSEPSRFVPNELVIVGGTESAVRRASVEGRAVALARELVNSPPCDLTPIAFADRASAATNGVNLSCELWDADRLRSERMHALLGVAQGSDNPPRLVILKHTPKPGEPALAFVGKGVTFDSGGLSLKTSDQMIDMKCDMAGAAAVCAATVAIAELELPVNVMGILALVENMPSGKALKLGDVVTARNGKTIEILNTDAEGRVILADALSYAAEQDVTGIVDLATLTGACMVALGTDIAGLMSNDANWTGHIQAAADACGEKVWPLPMHPHFDEALKSKVADLKNAPSNRYGGAITAAKFLEQFVGEKTWAHLDIAGPAFADKEGGSSDAGGTGFGVRTLIELARQMGS